MVPMTAIPMGKGPKKGIFAVPLKPSWTISFRSVNKDISIDVILKYQSKMTRATKRSILSNKSSFLQSYSNTHKGV